MEKLEKYITDERTGIKYELIDDNYFIAGDNDPDEHHPIDIQDSDDCDIFGNTRRYFTQNCCYMAN